jgi:hypothetical protein
VQPNRKTHDRAASKSEIRGKQGWNSCNFAGEITPEKPPSFTTGFYEQISSSKL